ncbi:efflux transporter outer membrane subunit [Paracoccus denitrificans]|uniref:efflux transporter outer membrane subunit n=1 Tax=Paracoccus denitrificans TaxID=266 RepID=UPI001E574AE4|nr:efflux transporter outer membrane subunit [Paracoccus denitrificans]UFS67473.1 efflux transporter outer membrane subunit [Paracoccus denitrificans]
MISPSRFFGPALLLLAAGCAAVGPDPDARPAIPVPATFVEGEAVSAGKLASRAFWAEYRDPVLNDLIARGLKQNLDEAAARERIRAAAADLRGTGVLAGQVSGTASAARERGASAGGAVQAAGNSSLGANFVFDLFGGARRERQGAAASLEAAKAGLGTARLAWIAELIDAYGDARYYQQALALTRKTVSTREETVRITRDQREFGVVSEFDMAQAEALLAGARAELPGYEAQFNAQAYRIATLLNEPAAGVLAQMKRGSGQPRIPGSARAGVPADLLRNRPDLRAAEYDLAAALAAVGVATADLLPSLSLTGSVSESGGAKSWGFGPAISFPVLNQGALQATRARRMAEAREAEIAWRAAVSQAVEDVQVAQSNLRRYREQAAALEGAATAYDRAYQLARTSFAEGELALLDLLDSDRSTASARLSAASARNQAAKEWAALQIATGAGAGEVVLVSR